MSTSQLHSEPVGYQFEFLKEYQLYRTYYLPAPLRLQLRKMGHAVHIESSASTGVRPSQFEQWRAAQEQGVKNP